MSNTEKHFFEDSSKLRALRVFMGTNFEMYRVMPAYPYEREKRPIYGKRSLSAREIEIENKKAARRCNQ